MFKWKKFLSNLAMAAAATALAITSASACTMIYVGGGLTADGSSYLARSEDYSNSYNKIAYVSEHGVNPEGSVYEGCYGFKHTFTHDSYAYTATRDDNTANGVGTIGTCPDCGQKHTHTPMEENGTNEMGVSVSAMVTLSWKSSSFKNADAMVSGGMCESDMTTILLGEAATAKEGVDLLLKIYDEQGAEERSGVLIGDQNESWYVENYTGHQYIAVKLSPDMIAISPNMGAIGLVDLDDTANVIASKGIIEVAKKAGSYVGDEEANTIDFRASYSATSINSRMINGLNYLKGENTFTSSNTSSADFTISNVKDGQIVSMYTPIQTNRTLTTKDLIDFYKVDGVGNTSNLEWHVFQINPKGAKETATIQWLAMENGQYTVAIPYYSILTTDMYEGYKVGGLGKVAFAATLPEGATGYFPYTNRGTAGYRVLPTGWEKGYYWSVDALSNYALSSACTKEDQAMVKAALAVMQEKCYDKAAEMGEKIAELDTAEAKAYATAESAALAKEAHELTLKLYNHLVTGEHTYEDGVCVCGEAALAIETQPVDFAGKVGDVAALTVEANKDNVTYQWFYSNNGWSWSKSSMEGNDSATLSVKMTAARVGQQYKCVITDANGDSVISDVVALTKASSALKIVTDPADVAGAINETVTFSVKVQSEGAVTYQWMYSNNGGASWSKSTAPGNATEALSIQVKAYRAGQMYKCVVTDANGICVESGAATMAVK